MIRGDVHIDGFFIWPTSHSTAKTSLSFQRRKGILKQKNPETFVPGSNLFSLLTQLLNPSDDVRAGHEHVRDLILRL